MLILLPVPPPLFYGSPFYFASVTIPFKNSLSASLCVAISIFPSIIRGHCYECLVVFNELYENDFARWADELTEEQGYVNVVIDTHLYDWQDPYTYETAQRHIQDAVNFKNIIMVKALLQAPPHLLIVK